MRAFVLALSLALAATAAHAADPVAPDAPIRIFGLEKLHFGMSAEEAAKAMPALKVTPGEGGFVALANPAYVYGGCRYALSIEAEAGKLSAITVVSAQNDPDCPLNIKEMLDDAYGLPYDSNTLNDGITYGWKKGALRIDSTQSPLLDYTHATVEMWLETPPPAAAAPASPPKG